MWEVLELARSVFARASGWLFEAQIASARLIISIAQPRKHKSEWSNAVVGVYAFIKNDPNCSGERERVRPCGRDAAKASRSGL
jgi:hypothetical protein